MVLGLEPASATSTQTPSSFCYSSGLSGVGLNPLFYSQWASTPQAASHGLFRPSPLIKPSQARSRTLPGQASLLSILKGSAARSCPESLWLRLWHTEDLASLCLSLTQTPSLASAQLRIPNLRPVTFWGDAPSCLHRPALNANTEVP